MAQVDASQIQAAFDAIESAAYQLLIGKHDIVDAIETKGGTVTYSTDPQFKGEAIFENLYQGVQSIPGGEFCTDESVDLSKFNCSEETDLAYTEIGGELPPTVYMSGIRIWISENQLIRMRSYGNKLHIITYDGGSSFQTVNTEQSIIPLIEFQNKVLSLVDGAPHYSVGWDSVLSGPFYPCSGLGNYSLSAAKTSSRVAVSNGIQLYYSDDLVSWSPGHTISNNFSILLGTEDSFWLTNTDGNTSGRGDRILRSNTAESGSFSTKNLPARNFWRSIAKTGNVYILAANGSNNDRLANSTGGNTWSLTPDIKTGSTNVTYYSPLVVSNNKVCFLYQSGEAPYPRVYLTSTTDGNTFTHTEVYITKSSEFSNTRIWAHPYTSYLLLVNIGGFGPDARMLSDQYVDSYGAVIPVQDNTYPSVRIQNGVRLENGSWEAFYTFADPECTKLIRQTRPQYTAVNASQIAFKNYWAVSVRSLSAATSPDIPMFSYIAPDGSVYTTNAPSDFSYYPASVFVRATNKFLVLFRFGASGDDYYLGYDYWISYDGVNWSSKLTLPDSATGGQVTVGPSGVFVTGISGAYFTSDGVYWTNIPGIPTTTHYRGDFQGAKVFVAYTSPYTLIWTIDLVTLNTLVLPVNGTTVITEDFIMVPTVSGSAWYTVDLQTWILHNPNISAGDPTWTNTFGSYKGRVLVYDNTTKKPHWLGLKK